MKKILKITMLLLACLCIVGVTDVDAQYGKKKKKKKKEKVEDNDDYFDESGGKFVDKLWYGGGFNLGYNGGNNRSAFNFGISPMVGYKVTDRLSFGPRAAILYSAIRDRDVFGQVNRGKSVNYGLGVFGRMKIFQSLFLHTEYSALNEAFYLVDGRGDLIVEPGTQKLATTREISNNFYVGGGYFSGGGGGLGYEFLLLYNVLAPDDVVEQPIEIRVGFTWGF